LVVGLGVGVGGFIDAGAASGVGKFIDLDFPERVMTVKTFLPLVWCHLMKSLVGRVRSIEALSSILVVYSATGVVFFSIVGRRDRASTLRCSLPGL